MCRKGSDFIMALGAETAAVRSISSSLKYMSELKIKIGYCE